MARIAIVEDQELFLSLLKDLCEQDSAHRVVIAASTGQKFRDELASNPIDLLLVDLNLPDCDGVELIYELVSLHPAARVLVISGDSRRMTLGRAIMAGVHGVVDKNVGAQELLRAIRGVAEGRTYFSEAIRTQFREQRKMVQKYLKILSKTELILLRLFGKGLTDDQVARHRRISPATAQTHRRNIMNKLKIRSSLELVQHCLEHGFVNLRGDGILQATSKISVSSLRGWADRGWEEEGLAVAVGRSVNGADLSAT